MSSHDMENFAYNQLCCLMAQWKESYECRVPADRAIQLLIAWYLAQISSRLESIETAVKDLHYCA